MAGSKQKKARPSRRKAAFRIVAVASSAGGLSALTTLLSALPADFPAPIAVVQHLDPRHRSVLADILARGAALRVKQADDGELAAAGTVYVAPPDHHLLVNGDGTVSLTHTELVHFVRPSADLLFDSAAAAFGRRTLAVVLTGTGRDGSMGVCAVRKVGGKVIAQDERSSQFFGMPSAAIQTGCVDIILPLERIAAALVSLVAKGTV